MNQYIFGSPVKLEQNTIDLISYAPHTTLPVTCSFALVQMPAASVQL